MTSISTPSSKQIATNSQAPASVNGSIEPGRHMLVGDHLLGRFFVKIEVLFRLDLQSKVSRLRISSDSAIAPCSLVKMFGWYHMIPRRFGVNPYRDVEAHYLCDVSCNMEIWHCRPSYQPTV